MTAPTIEFVGQLGSNGCKTGERYYIVEIESPYPHEAHLTVVSRPGEDCDAFIAAIGDFEDGPAVRVRPRLVDGSLVATIDDLEIVTGD